MIPLPMNLTTYQPVNNTQYLIPNSQFPLPRPGPEFACLYPNHATIDSLTHIALGACIGELAAGRRLGKKALLIGALAQSLPDIDSVASAWLSTPDELLAHRGPTHSLLFVAVATLLLSAAAARWYPSRPLTARSWAWLIGANLFAHLLVDCFNAYGTALWLPFSEARVSWHALYVADPLFSLAPAVAALLLVFHRAGSRRRRPWAAGALLLCGVGLVAAVGSKAVAEKAVRQALVRQGVKYDRFFSTPTPLNSLLWLTVARTDSGLHLAYRSVLDGSPHVAFTFFPRRDDLLAAAPDRAEVDKLLQFADGFYTVEQWGDTLVFNVPRFGQVVGWHDPRGSFAFHYYLNYPDDNDLVVQRGRFLRWDRTTFRSLLRRIGGKTTEAIPRELL